MDVTAAEAPAGFPVRVFAIELPIDDVVLRYSMKSQVHGSITPTMNEFSSMPGWKKGLVRGALDKRIVLQLRQGGWPRGRGVGEVRAKLVRGKAKTEVVTGERRVVVVTRHSSRRVDELSVDVIGGKVPVDRLVIAGILAGDSAKWLERVARWERAAPGEGKLAIEVFAPAVPTLVRA